jgi:hypothetical protein
MLSKTIKKRNDYQLNDFKMLKANIGSFQGKFAIFVSNVFCLSRNWTFPLFGLV